MECQLSLTRAHHTETPQYVLDDSPYTLPANSAQPGGKSAEAPMTTWWVLGWFKHQKHEKLAIVVSGCLRMFDQPLLLITPLGKKNRMQKLANLINHVWSNMYIISRSYLDANHQLHMENFGLLVWISYFTRSLIIYDPVVNPRYMMIARDKINKHQ